MGTAKPALIAGLCSISLLLGQTVKTWGGLTFGMSPLDAMTTLKGKSPALKVASASDPTMISIKEVKVGKFTGETRVVFDRSFHLVRVNLLFYDFSPNNLLCNADIPVSVESYRIRMITGISDMLLGKYGKPIDESGWPSHQELNAIYINKSGRVQGKRMWKAEGQIVQENLAIFCRSVWLTISYYPQATGDEL